MRCCLDQRSSVGHAFLFYIGDNPRVNVRTGELIVWYKLLEKESSVCDISAKSKRHMVQAAVAKTKILRVLYMAKNLHVHHGWWHRLNWRRVVTVKALQDLLTLLIPSHITTVQKTWTASAEERHYPPAPLQPLPHTSNMATCMSVRVVPHPTPNPPIHKKDRKNHR